MIDSAVWQPCRLDFAGGADCSNGLEQQRGAPVLIPGSVEIVDTATALPSLTPAETSELSKLVKAARSDDEVQTDAKLAREAWIAERAEEMAERIEAGDNSKPDEIAEATARSALDHAELGGAFHRANQAIAHGEKNLSEVARMSGYDSLAAFSQAYKKWFGKSPTKYSMP